MGFNGKRIVLVAHTVIYGEIFRGLPGVLGVEGKLGVAQGEGVRKLDALLDGVRCAEFKVSKTVIVVGGLCASIQGGQTAVEGELTTRMPAG